MPETPEQIIRRVASTYNFTDPDLLIAVGKQESGLNPRAQGDYVRGAPQSFGLFQENVRGRGAGLAPDQSYDVEAATRRAIAEFQAIRARTPNADRGTWAALAQRPADPRGYAASVNRLLGSGALPQTFPAGPAAPQADPNAPAWYKDMVGARDMAFRYGRDEGPGPQPIPLSPAAPTEGGDPGWYRELLGGQATGTSGAAPSSGGLYFTLEGQSRVKNQLTNPFGAAQTRSAGFTGSLPAQNYGVDIAAPVGTPVHAPAGARVKQVLRAGQQDYGYGHSVVLDLGGGVELQLSHLRDAPGYRPGDAVAPDEIVGRVGLTGNTTGPHTDHALRVDGRPVDFFKLYDDPAIRRRLGAFGGPPASGAGGPSGGEPDWFHDLMKGR